MLKMMTVGIELQTPKKVPGNLFFKGQMTNGFWELI